MPEADTGRAEKPSEELLRLQAQYRRMPFRQPARLYPQLKRRQRAQRAERDRVLDEMRAQALKELREPIPEVGADCEY